MPLPIIERRRIEAEIVGHLYRELVERMGEEVARGIIDGAIRKAAIAHGQTCRADLGRMPDFKDFEAILQFHAKHGVRKLFNHHAFNFDPFFFCHNPFRF